jgi:hypothetical protein
VTDIDNWWRWTKEKEASSLDRLTSDLMTKRSRVHTTMRPSTPPSSSTTTSFSSSASTRSSSRAHSTSSRFTASKIYALLLHNDSEDVQALRQHSGFDHIHPQPLARPLPSYTLSALITWTLATAVLRSRHSMSCTPYSAPHAFNGIARQLQAMQPMEPKRASTRDLPDVNGVWIWTFGGLDETHRHVAFVYKASIYRIYTSAIYPVHFLPKALQSSPQTPDTRR